MFAKSQHGSVVIGATFGWLLCNYLLSHVAMAELEPLACGHDEDAPPKCEAILYVPSRRVTQNLNTTQIASLYNASSLRVLPDFRNGSLVLVDCGCQSISNPVSQVYFALTSYTPTDTDTGLGISQISHNTFDDLAWNQSDGEIPITGRPLTLYLGCGCLPLNSSYRSVISYAVQSGDILGDIANEFQANVETIASFNHLSNANLIQAAQVLFLPSSITPSVIPNTTTVDDPSKVVTKKRGHVNLGLIIGVALSSVAVLVVIVFIIYTAVAYNKKKKGLEKHKTSAAGPNKSTSTTLFLSSWNAIFSKTKSSKDKVRQPVPLPGDAQAVFENEKPIVYAYQEVVEACSYFLESAKLGEGAFGVVYHGHIRNHEVAIKKMKACKSREFVAELKVLCKVHHSNLIELIGYAVGQEELFLIYEFAENGTLSDHLHDPHNKGCQPLTWMQRVQIALDAARGLEYLHDHTRIHYVHRDVKTSNILLDGHFRAKMGDFGLAKLIEKASGEDQHLTTRVVGTVGYLAPEYIRDGQVTSKNDVYAFGVVLMELITGLEALSKSKAADDVKCLDQRSLVSLLYKVGRGGQIDFEKLFPYVDPNLSAYPEKGLYKLAQLARDCVMEESTARPDMREIVFKLSRILLSSVEWEATMAGNSQVFTGLVQGR